MMMAVTRSNSLGISLRRIAMRAALRPLGYGNDDLRTNGERRFIASLPLRDGVVVDAGANAGGWTSMLLAIHPLVRVHCCEPSASAFAELERHLSRRVILHNVALSDRDGETTLLADQPGSETASVYPRQGARLGERVRTVRIDTLCREQGIDHIALLKIDTEGHELAVLRGAGLMLDKIDAIQFEYGGTAIDARIYLRDFYDLLADRFVFSRLWRFGVIREPIWHELLEIATYQNWACIRRP